MMAREWGLFRIFHHTFSSLQTWQSSQVSLIMWQCSILHNKCPTAAWPDLLLAVLHYSTDLHFSRAHRRGKAEHVSCCQDWKWNTGLFPNYYMRINFANASFDMIRPCYLSSKAAAFEWKLKRKCPSKILIWKSITFCYWKDWNYFES